MLCPAFFVIFLSLQVYITVVSSETECSSEFNDPGSKAIMANIVFEGVVAGRSQVRDGRYNATFVVSDVLLGNLPYNPLSHRFDAVIGTPFALMEDKLNCVGSVHINERLIVYLGPADNLGSPPVYTISALPDVSTNQVITEIRETVCPNCRKYNNYNQIYIYIYIIILYIYIYNYIQGL